MYPEKNLAGTPFTAAVIGGRPLYQPPKTCSAIPFKQMIKNHYTEKL
jgi:hypothetical protein